MRQKFKLYLTVAGLGLGAVVADRFIFNDDAGGYTPRSRAAAETAGASSGGVVGGVVENAGAAIRNRLEQAAAERILGSMETPDAFMLPEGWLAAANVDDPSEAEPTSSPETRARLRLGGVMPSADGGVASINGTNLRIGDKIEGYELVHVARGEARLRQGDQEVILTTTRPVQEVVVVLPPGE